MCTTNYNIIFYRNYLNYLQSSEKHYFPKCSNKLSSTIGKLICTNCIKVVIDELVITNSGKKNFYLFEHQLSMQERYKHKQKPKLFNEKTLEPMYKTLKRMSAIKLENDM